MKKNRIRGLTPDPPEMAPMPLVTKNQSPTQIIGIRDKDGICHLYKANNDYQVEIRPDRSLKVMNHSPTGFEWGYGGSGPSQSALAILLELTDDTQLSLSLYHQFKSEVVANMPHDEWAINVERTMEWVRQKTEAL